MKWAATLAFVVTLLASPADARLDTPVDESIPGLVKRYMFLPCDALKATAIFQYAMLQHEYRHLEECRALVKTVDYKYAQLMCLYVEMKWQFVYDHLASVQVAGELMCEDDGTRKNPEYEIHF